MHPLRQLELENERLRATLEVAWQQYRDAVSPSLRADDQRAAFVRLGATLAGVVDRGGSEDQER